MSSISFVDPGYTPQTPRFANVGAFALLVFDFCITFQDEVNQTWLRSWDVTRVIFVISRYLPFIGVALTVYGESYILTILIFWVLLTAVIDDLDASGQAENIIHIISIIAAEGLLVIRTWVFWKRSKRMLIVLAAYSIVTIVAATSINVLRNGQLTAVSNAVSVYLLLALFECVILTLTVYKRFSDYRKSEGSIVTALYNGSMFYMSCIIGAWKFASMLLLCNSSRKAITVLNVLNDAVFPAAYMGMFDALQIVIHSILASRIMFHIRSSHDQVHEMHALSVSEAMQFGQPSQMQTTSNASERRNDANSLAAGTRKEQERGWRHPRVLGLKKMAEDAVRKDSELDEWDIEDM
ncbi:hypothetical protein BDR04DRAFT_1158452 [Suillus decipiens]|nr:hypothetical protein BDR04DRAFT_1158452 [Suillus decipiens]